MRKIFKIVNILVLALSVSCVGLYGCGVRDEVITFTTDEEVTESAAYEDTQANGVGAQAVYVYVCGAVNTPGVYELAAGSRVNDALEAAGGFAEEADRDYVNLAAGVEDGQKLVFPTVSETELMETEQARDALGLVNINTADQAALMSLTGIGETKALDIIAYRESNGGFKAKEDITKVSGIGQSTYNKIADKITVD